MPKVIKKNPDVAALLQDALAREKMTITALARESGVPRNTVGALVRGEVQRASAGPSPGADTLIMRITGHKSLAMLARYGQRTSAESARREYRRRMGS